MLNVLVSIVFVLNPAGSEIFVEPPPLFDGAYATEPAVRLDPPMSVEPEPIGFSSESAHGRCVGAEPLLAQESPGWSVERMSRIMYRESRCRPDVRNGSSGSTGLLQVMPSNCRYIASKLGEPCTVSKLQDPRFNIRAGAVLYRYDGYGPWAL